MLRVTVTVMLSPGCRSCVARETDASAEPPSPARSPPLPLQSSLSAFAGTPRPRAEAETWVFLPRRKEGPEPKECANSPWHVVALGQQSAPLLGSGWGAGESSRRAVRLASACPGRLSEQGLTSAALIHRPSPGGEEGLQGPSRGEQGRLL